MYEKEMENIVGRFKLLSREQLQKINALDSENAKREYEDFSVKFTNGVCYLCGDKLDHIGRPNACLHWLLVPKSFKKKELPGIYAKFDYFQIMSYVRWVASTEGVCTYVNDLVEEHSESNVIDCTINYKNMEWSFSCSQLDFEGHPSSEAGDFPHFHMQIRIDDKIFIKYNDFHIPFRKEDVVRLIVIRDFPDMFKHTFGPGEGMQQLLDSKNVYELAMDSTPVSDESESTFHLQTLIMAEPGECISGDEVAKLIEECKQKNVTLASMAHKLGGKRTTVISPGRGVPKPKPRRGRKTKRKNG
jgi:hypothetical protein